MFPTIRDSLTGISSKVVKFAEKQEPKKKLLRSLELQQIFTVEQTKKKGKNTHDYFDRSSKDQHSLWPCSHNEFKHLLP